MPHGYGRALLTIQSVIFSSVILLLSLFPNFCLFYCERQHQQIGCIALHSKTHHFLITKKNGIFFLLHFGGNQNNRVNWNAVYRYTPGCVGCCSFARLLFYPNANLRSNRKANVFIARTPLNTLVSAHTHTDANANTVA